MADPSNGLLDPQTLAALLMGQGQPPIRPMGPSPAVQPDQAAQAGAGYAKQLGLNMFPSLAGPSDEDMAKYQQVQSQIQKGEFKPGKIPLAAPPEKGPMQHAAEGALDAVSNFGFDDAGAMAKALMGSKALQSIFIGPLGARNLAKIATRFDPMADLHMARGLESIGTPREDIWSRTGWFRGPDAQWKHEIPDNDLKVKEGFGFGLGTKSPMKNWQLESPIQHPLLEKIYPQTSELQNFVTSQLSPGEAEVGSYRKLSNRPFHAELNVEGHFPEEARAIAGHELQHPIQAFEGFGRGGTQSNVQQSSPPFLSQWEAYRRLAGEVEARNVEKRLDYSPTERYKAIPPWETMDVPEHQQIIKILMGQGS
jgi:hypothetical protein